MALLKGFFDETGPHKGGAITGIGGLVGAADDWTLIEEPWQGVLDEYASKGLRWLHTTEAVTQRGQFACIDKPGVNYILTQLSQTLGRHELTPFFSAVVTDDWHVLTDSQFLERFPTPIDLCFENLVQTLWKWGHAHARGELIVPMFAYSTEFAPRMAELGRVYGAHDWYSRILGPIAFGRPQQVIPLQAADLLVHQARWNQEKGVSVPLTLANAGQTNMHRWATGGRYQHGNWFDAEGLLLTERRFREAGYPSGPVGLF